jgi:hypothetical protein
MTEGTLTSANAGIAPRVFISYARTDGEPFATKLRQRLEAVHIPLWQDRVGLEGGKDWWLQITEALEKVEFLVPVMTPAAMGSETVRKEWRYARQQGVCVYPVKGVPDLDFASLPQTGVHSATYLGSRTGLTLLGNFCGFSCFYLLG